MSDFSKEIDVEDIPAASSSDEVEESRSLSDSGTLGLKRKGEPLPSLQTHYKSKTFTAQSGVNPLSAAGAALFSLITKLRQQLTYPDVSALQKNLIDEIRAFQWAAQSRGYKDEEVLVARYAICATLDEVIESTPWGEEARWQENNLLLFFQGENWGGDRFFLILDKVREFPETYIDVLEFIFLCLTLGFEGKFRIFEQGKEKLARIIDELYHLIRRQRNRYSNRLCAPAKPLGKEEKAPQELPPLWIIVLTMIAALSLVYCSFNYLTALSLKPVYTAFDTLTKVTKE